MSDTPVFDQTLAMHDVNLDETLTVVEKLPRYPIESCDGHASGSIQALYNITLPSGGSLYLCGSCAAKHGFAQHQNDTTWLREETKTQGSEH